MNIPKNEYPRPQMVRESWINLNGDWDFEFDFGKTGKERKFYETNAAFSKKITVPFCPESTLSGVGYTDFMNAVWYRRSFEIKEKRENERILLHFEAVDHKCEVWINGGFAGGHIGGYTPFCLDITDKVNEGENIVTLYAEDDCRDPMQPRGKQSETYHSRVCDYTRVTGIWQTVWLERVPQNYIKGYRCTSDIDNCCIQLEAVFAKDEIPAVFSVNASYNGKKVGERTVKANGSGVKLELPLDELHLWQPLAAELYDLELVLDTANGCDRVMGYFGMRDVTIGKKAILINHKPVFQRLVLDQGFYPDGIYTAPDDEALKRDIELSIAMGFNGARMHQKVFERRYLYWADKLGYLIWGEYGNWGLDHSDPESLEMMLFPWMEAVKRDFNSPALIGWCPFNETWDYKNRRQDNDVLRAVYRVTKQMDNTRPCIDTSGNYHVETDIFDVHDYEQDVEKFSQHYEAMANDGEYFITFSDRQKYGGQPYFVSEYGGILWNESKEQGWGYGNAPKTVEEFVTRYEGLADVLLRNKNIFGLCYTQLYDVEQEKNGIYRYDRSRKFDKDIMERLRAAMIKPAAIEKE